MLATRGRADAARKAGGAAIMGLPALILDAESRFGANAGD